MKHTHFSQMMAPAAFLLMLAAACTDDNGPSALSDSTADNTAISFRPQAADTRAVVENDFPYGAAFSVWGWYQRTDGTIGQPFNATTVTNNGGWTYQGTQYWVDDATYDFYAIYPASVANAGVESDGTIRVTGFDCSARGENAIDLMTAEAEDVAGSTHSTVGLNFKHLLTRLSFTITSEGDAVTINNASLYSINYKGDYNSSNANQPWSNLTACAETDTPFSTSSLSLTESALSSALFNGDLLLPPHASLTNATLKLAYQYEGDDETYESTLSLSTGQVTAWDANQHYQYTINIPQNGVEVTLNVTVNEWAEQDFTVQW